MVRILPKIKFDPKKCCISTTWHASFLPFWSDRYIHYHYHMTQKVPTTSGAKKPPQKGHKNVANCRMPQTKVCQTNKWLTKDQEILKCQMVGTNNIMQNCNHKCQRKTAVHREKLHYNNFSHRTVSI